jgi:hypothetical protein
MLLSDFYSLNGAELITEIPLSKAGLYFGKPLTESTTIYILMSNGRFDINHFEITPIDSSNHPKWATKLLLDTAKQRS